MADHRPTARFEMQHEVDDLMQFMSPLGARGEQRLARLRSAIHERFDPANAAACSPASKLRQRLARASTASVNNIFSRSFDCFDDDDAFLFDLARPPQAATAAPVMTTSAFANMPSPVSATHHVSQLERPAARLRTPRKVAIKRSRAGEGSAERARRKPRLHSPSARMLTFGSSQPSMSRFCFDADGDVAMDGKPEAPLGRAAFFATRASPSKLHFSSTASKALFAPSR